MQWEFSAQDVVKGEAEYDIAAFRRDFFEEVQGNMRGVLAPGDMRVAFDQLYDLSYWLATGRALDSFDGGEGPFGPQDFAVVAPMLAANIEMLGALLQRLIMDGIAQGLDLDAAVAAAARRHEALVSEPLSSAPSRSVSACDAVPAGAQ